MRNTFRVTVSGGRAWLLALVAALAVTGAMAQAPAQRPLLSRSGGVKPNVMLTLDVSNSMRFQHMPEGLAVVGTTTLASPAATVSTRFHPADDGRQAYHFAFSEGTTYTSDGRVAAAGNGVVAGVPGATSAWPQRFLRSADTNPVYYNPQVRYEPWLRPDGTRMAAAVPARAVLDPTLAGVSTIDLTSAQASVGATWCHTPSQPDGCEMPTQVWVVTPGPKGRGGTGAWQTVQKTLTFAPGLYYRLRQTNGAYLDPRQAASYDEFDINTVPASGVYRRYPKRTDCAATGCTQAQERQNFANWFVYYRSRLLFAKAALGEALYALDDSFRIGYGRTSKWDAADVDGISLRVVESGVRDYTPARRTAVMDWLYALESDGGTPLRLTLQEVGKYYESPLATGPWSDAPGTQSTAPHKTCRRAYHILVTDGYWIDIDKGILTSVGDADGTDGTVGPDGTTGVGISGPAGREWIYKAVRPFSGAGADTLADYAMAYWKKDLRPDLANGVPPSAANPAFWQSMTNFTVGLGVRGLLDPAKDLPELTREGGKSWGIDRIDDLWHAAVNSRGEYFSAQNAEQLGAALYSAVRKAVERELREAGVATATATLEASNRKYIPTYRSGVWTGDVEAYALAASGLTGVRLWSARERLPAAAQRKIFTWDAGLTVPIGVAFDWATLSGVAQASIASGYRDADFINFIRGDRAKENAVDGYRVRESVLGDFINSTPVFAREASDPVNTLLPIAGRSYETYVRETKATRVGLLWVGGNDGMLHAFRDSRGVESARDGEEAFAYVPSAVMGQLHTLAMRNYGSPANEHRYFVDGPLREADLWVPAPGASTPSWRNYLFGSAGAGARAVFGLDITDPTALGAATLRWEVNAASQPELGYVTAPVLSGQLPNGKSVALFGNGVGGKSSEAYLFMVEAATGVVTTLRVAPSVTGNGLGGVAAVRNAVGQIVTLYAGDLQGSLWRFDYDASTGGFKPLAGGVALFKASAGQPIVQAPMVFPHDKGGQLVVFGTGRLLTEADASDQTIQSIYAVHDLPNDKLARPLSRANLASRALQTAVGTQTKADQVFFDLVGQPVNWAEQRGWFIDLAVAGYAGLRMIYPIQQAWDRIVLASTVAPAAAGDGCETTSGKGINLLLPIDTGLMPTQPVFDTNGDGVFNSSDTVHSGYASNADGGDGIVRASGGGGGGGDPPPPLPPPPCELISLQNTTGQMTACYTPPTRRLADRIWWRIVSPPL